MYLEYDWTFNVYRPRFGQHFTAWRGRRSFETLAEAKEALADGMCKLGPKTDTRTWAIIPE